MYISLFRSVYINLLLSFTSLYLYLIFRAPFALYLVVFFQSRITLFPTLYYIPRVPRLYSPIHFYIIRRPVYSIINMYRRFIAHPSSPLALFSPLLSLSPSLTYFIYILHSQFAYSVCLHGTRRGHFYPPTGN